MNSIMWIKKILLIFALFESSSALSSIEHYYECPLKSICQTMVDHYRLDPGKNLIFQKYKGINVILNETKKDRRLTGIFALTSTANITKTNNVITLYDGFGIQGNPTQSNLMFGNFSFNLNYDLRLLEDKLAPINNSLISEKINIRRLIFRDLQEVFPRYSPNQRNNSRRGLFRYLYNIDVIKGTSTFLDKVKKTYLKATNLYKRKAITIESLREISDLVVRASEKLFDAQNSMDIMFPNEFRLKKKLDLIKSAVEKKEDLIISENLNEEASSAKICSLIEFIEREEGVAIGSLDLNFKNADRRWSFFFPGGVTANISGSFDNPMNAAMSVAVGVNYRLFDTTENYIARIMYRENKKDTAQIYADNKVKEFERVQGEAQSYYQVKEYFNNVKFNYEQVKIFNKGLYRGSLFKNTLRVRDNGMDDQSVLMQEHLTRELRLKFAKAVFLSNIFRVKAVCKIVDETVKDLE